MRGSDRERQTVPAVSGTRTLHLHQALNHPIGTENIMGLKWTVETRRNGITLEMLSDDLGVFGTPGTWYRVSDGTERGLLTTRHRGDALRRFQSRAFRASGA